jgi:hypothetical protein
VTNSRARYGPHNSDGTYISHQIAEMDIDVGEVRMNYATTVGVPPGSILDALRTNTEHLLPTLHTFRR